VSRPVDTSAFTQQRYTETWTLNYALDEWRTYLGRGALLGADEQPGEHRDREEHDLHQEKTLTASL
jgi:hypothetical protein